MMVPAVTEVCLPHPAHSQVHALVCSSHALLLPQPGQTKPCGQRAAARYPTQAASSGKRRWNSINERGKSVKVASRSSVVRDLFYHEPAPPATTNGVPGRRGISLLGRFARKLGFAAVGNRSEFAVVSVEGFNPERIRSLKSGMETTLGRR